MQFRLGRIPVRVHGSFFIMAVLFGAAGTRSPQVIGIWMAVVFVSVLLHEMGHATTGRAFGLVPRIDLHGMGGTTSWPAGRKVSTGQSVLISLAGPFAGLAVCAAVLVAVRFGLEPRGELARVAIEDILWVNGGWGVLNLLPMLPLDGGNVMAALLSRWLEGRGERAARIVSIVVSGAAGLLALVVGWTWPALLAGMFFFRNVQGLRQASLASDEEPLVAAVQEAYVALEKRDGKRMIELTEPVVANAKTPELRQAAVRLLAYGRLIEGHWGELMALLERAGKELGNEELTRLEQAATEMGRPEEAARIHELVAAGAPSAFRA